MSILFELERMERLAADLSELRIRTRIPVTDYLRREGKQKDGAVCSTAGWKPCRIDEQWNLLNEYRWYRATITIPEQLQGAHVELLVTTGREGEWDATNPQMKYYLNGTLVQGVDVNHRRLRVTDCAQAGEVFEIAFQIYSGSVPGDLIMRTDLIAVDVRTEKVYYDFLVPVQTARLLKNSDAENYRRILVKLGSTADALDLRAPYSDSYYRAMEEAEAVLKEEFYTKVNEQAPVVSAIGHTHIDVAWLWTVAVTREKAVRSFSTVLELMDRYPDYRFMSSQPILYQFVKEQEPELYERIKARIREGRWEADGAMWLEADCNLPSGESLVRQVIKGEQFFECEFGVASRCLWLPDVFGYSAAIPQILKKCDIPYFLTTKIAWNQFNQLPNDTFIWKGIDGSDVFVFMPTTCDFDKTLGLNISFTDTRNTTTYTGIVNPNMTLGTFKRFQNRDLTENTLMLFGFGDGGGGPTGEMLEEAERLKYGMPGIPRLVQEPERTFFDRISQEITQKPGMPVWNGELYFEYHRGTLTSMGKNKRNNRKSEVLYEQLETVGSLAEFLYGIPYPEEVMRKGWDIILLNQFHDIIPGSSIEAVYNQTDLEYREILEDGSACLAQLTEEAALKEIENVEVLRLDAETAKCGSGQEKVKTGAESVFVVNTQGYARSDVAALKADADHRYMAVRDADGNLSPVQYTPDGEMLFFAEELPSVGYRFYQLVEKAADDTSEEESQSGICEDEWNGIYENSWYRAVFDEELQIRSLTEKESGFELIPEGRVGNELMTYEDRPMNWDNWDLDMYYKRKPYPADEVSKPVLKENGPVRTVVSVRKRFGSSIVEQDVILYRDLPRIDFATMADWQDHHVLLRANFPTGLNATKAAYEIQYGNVERETTHNHSWDTAKFEVCAHRWCDLSEEGMGLSLLNDCKYGHSIKDGELGLTLIKSGVYPNENADIGHHEFAYSIYPHAGGWRDGRTVEMACDLNIPLLAQVLPDGEGDGGRAAQTGGVVSAEKSLISVSDKNCFFETLKKAEDGDGYILRIYENQNKRTRFTVSLGFKIASVEECNLLEKKLRELETDGTAFTDCIKPYEIKTYRIRK